MNFPIPFLGILKRNFRLEISYRFAFFLKLFSTFSHLLIFFFISRLLPHDWPQRLYGGNNYFEFVLIGLACSSFFGVGLSGFSFDLRQEALMGTLESLVTTPLSFSALAAYTYAGRFLMAFMDLVILIILGILFFGVSWHPANIPYSLLILFLSGLAFSGLGTLAASFTLVFKRGDPVSQIVSFASDFFGGVYFPVAVLPKILQHVSWFLPTPYALRALRATFLEGRGWSVIGGDCMILFFFATLFMSLGTLSLHAAARRVRQEGSITHY